ncbi:hypothetical protein FRC12_007917 [Ceratobasidium sp. 428]|nr:hypothetical protein FRC12_007917 [Ceratobasidium sp. 428]
MASQRLFSLFRPAQRLRRFSLPLVVDISPTFIFFCTPRAQSLAPSEGEIGFRPPTYFIDAYICPFGASTRHEILPLLAYYFLLLYFAVSEAQGEFYTLIHSLLSI